MNKHILTPVLLFILFFIGMAAIQFATPNLPDNDGFYHIKIAELMRTESLKPYFPWLPMSILNEREFYDHHFLFHVLLIPFTIGDLLTGAKLAAVSFSSLAFLSIWYLLHRQNIPVAWLWALALFGISEAFLFRMSIVRAQSLSLGVLALGLTWVLERKYKHLAVLSFFYVWMYNAFPLILMLAGLQIAAVYLVEKRVDASPLLWTAAGVLAGMIFNPYFPANVVFTYHHFLPKLTNAISVSVGNEWYPYTTDQLLKNSLPVFIAFVAGIFALGLNEKKMNSRTAVALLLALFFGVMLFKARRFVEYFPPFALIFAAFAVSSLSGTPILRLGSYLQFRVSLQVVLLIVFIGAGSARTIPQAQSLISNSKPSDLYEGASIWLAENTKKGERVFQTDWDDFPRLFFYNTHNTYLAGLDPTYFQIYDADLYEVWVEITRGNVEEPSRIIRSRFSAAYVHTDLKHTGFIRRAEDDRGLLEVYRDEQAVIYKVLE